MYSALVYVKRGCPKCKLTVKQLSRFMKVETNLVDLIHDTEKIEQFRKAGYQSFPVVHILKNGTKVDEWSDFQVKAIQQWQKKVQS